MEFIRKYAKIIHQTTWLWELVQLVAASLAMVLLTSLSTLMNLLNDSNTSLNDYQVWLGSLITASVLTVVKQVVAWMIVHLNGRNL